MKSFLRFREGPAKPKTRTWSVTPQRDPRDLLGAIRWHGPWRRYCFFLGNGLIFDAACLRELAEFCDAQTRAHTESSQGTGGRDQLPPNTSAAAPGTLQPPTKPEEAP